MRLLRHALLGDDRGRISIPVNAALMVVLSLALLLLPNVALAASEVLLLITIALTILFIGIAFDEQIALSGARLACVGGLVFVCVILSFAGVYYTQSQTHPHAFSKPLGRLDAIYFSIGTTSPRGTDGFEARSGGARAELALQETVDATALALLLGSLLWRLSRHGQPVATAAGSTNTPTANRGRPERSNDE
jgi:hypothetical protein